MRLPFKGPARTRHPEREHDPRAVGGDEAELTRHAGVTAMVPKLPRLPAPARSIA